jgi:hypothetical protein
MLASRFLVAAKGLTRRSPSVTVIRGFASGGCTEDAHHISTRLIHAGQDPDPQTGAVVPPLILATTYAQKKAGTLQGTEMGSSFGKGFEYSRTGNPTRGAYELLVASGTLVWCCCGDALPCIL